MANTAAAQLCGVKQSGSRCTFMCLIGQRVNRSWSKTLVLCNILAHFYISVYNFILSARRLVSVYCVNVIFLLFNLLCFKGKAFCLNEKAF